MKKILIPALIIPLFLTFIVLQLEAATIKYTCPMHPHYISDIEGSCPICGMDLVELEVGDSVIDGRDKGSISSIQFTPHLVQRTGYRSEPVEKAQFGRLIRSFGEVVPNKRLQSDVSLRVEGWVEELVVDAPGDVVEKGDILFSVYSPQLMSAQHDYLSALKSGYRERINVAKDRLYSLGMQEVAVQLVSQKKQALRNVPFYAPVAGSVENINIREGSYLKSGALALRIQNYKEVWVRVNIAEQDIAFVHQNSVVNIDLPSSGLHLENVPIDYIAPTVDPLTRTAELRLLVDNTSKTIKPGSFVDVEIDVETKLRLSVPYESILQGKAGNYVVLDLGEGHFTSRNVTLGIHNKGRIEAIQGLQVGDKVVTSGQFLIDSESSLRESFQKMQKLSASLDSLELTKEQMVLMNHIIESALYIYEEVVSHRFPDPDILEVGAKATEKLQMALGGTSLQYILDDISEIYKGSDSQQTLSDWRVFLQKLTNALKSWVVDGKPNYYKNLGILAFEDEKGLFWLQFSLPGKTPYTSPHFSEIVLGDGRVQ